MPLYLRYSLLKAKIEEKNPNNLLNFLKMQFILDHWLHPVSILHKYLIPQRVVLCSQQ